ncbi:MAG TPA: HAD family hydrolase [Thermoplasmata archaeon]|nr:HAD family hydrolase [Thermoplasmata archaeon]HYB77253.1 HAD family hydrolase [Thermoplasmata archaeon]
MPPPGSEPKFLEPLLGIVFDLDGTLVLSHHDFGRMRHEVIGIAERYGVPPGHLSVQDPIHRIVENAREELRNAGASDGILYRFEVDYQKSIDTIELEALPRTVARPGAAELLKTLSERGYRIGLLTRSSETFCRQALLRTQLAPYFSYLRSRSSSGPAKPSPEALLMLLKDMGVPTDRALYVGDHLLDAECARRASVRFYAVMPDPSEAEATHSTMTEDRFLAAGAAAIAKDLPELRRQLTIAAPPLVG